MRSTVLFILLFTCITLTSQETRLALVIGNSNYEHSKTLLNPENDAESMAEVLGKLGYEVVLHTNLDLRDMKKAIDDFGHRLGNYNSGLFYYAGHGIQVRGYNYLVPVDANLVYENDTEYNCVRAGRILSRMEESKNPTNIVILDACRDNPFQRSWSRSSSGNGLAFMEAPTGSLIAYATSPGNTASDGAGSNGLYTSVLMEYMADPNLNALQVFQNVRKKVRLNSGGLQVPWESTSLEGDFYFNQTGDKIIGTLLSDTERNNTETDLELKSQIKENESIIWAESTSNVLIEADEYAKLQLHNLIKEFLDEKDILNSNRSAGDYDPIIQEVLSLSSREVFHQGGDIHVIRYISQKSITDLLDLKKNRVYAFLNDAMFAEDNGNIGEALKYYYWTYALALVHPEELHVPAQSGEGSEILTEGNLTTYSTERINQILGEVTCSIIDSISDNRNKKLKIEFRCQDKRIDHLNYRYWDGNSWSRPNEMSNGTGIIETGSSISQDDIKISIDYQYINKSKFDQELYMVLQSVSSPDMDNDIALGPRINKVRNEVDQAFIEVQDTDTYQEIIVRVINKVSMGDNQFDDGLFTQNGYEVFHKLLCYGNASFFKSESPYDYIKYQNRTFVRGVTAKFSFSHNETEFVEDLCFQIDSLNRVENIAFSLSDKSLTDILSHSRWTSTDKWRIISFLEDYKTAYALERYDYISKIFSDDALIIVGRKIHETQDAANIRLNVRGKDYELIKLSKEQYLYRLRKVFDRNEFINIRFEENTVIKRDNESDIFGINIRQNYYSTHYADQGYLFLLVDLNEEQDVKIYVRAWQPEKFDDGSVINLSSFTY